MIQNFQLIKPKPIIAFFAVLSFIFIPRVSNESGLGFPHILTEEDYIYEEEDTEPGVIIIEPYQEYKSYWYCFNKPLLELRCIDWAEETKQDASVTIYENDFIFDFSLDADEMKNECSSQLEEWNRIIKEGNDICLYGAFLQHEEALDRNKQVIYRDEKHIILVIYAIKTEQGIWSYFTDGRIPGTELPDSLSDEETLPESDVETERNKIIQDEIY